MEPKKASLIATSMDLEVPHDFPAETFDQIHQKVQKKVGGYDSNPVFWNQYGAAWNALAYRFRACAEFDEEFTDSIEKHGPGPAQSKRYPQEKALFCFFFTGVSVIETFCHGLYAIASLSSPDTFAIQTETQSRSVSPQSTAVAFEKEFPGGEITASLKTVVESDRWKELVESRNILAHRGHPGRGFGIRTPAGGWARWMNIPLDITTTAVRRKWLGDNIKILVRSTLVFCDKYLPLDSSGN
jgi:hypothetical protein